MVRDWHALGGDGGLDGAGGLDGYPNSYVTSIKVDRDTIYIGGYFGRAFYQDGYVTAKSIAKWDGEKWHAVSPFSNVNGQLITSISVDNGIIYASGKFPRAGMPKANKVVRWDGVEWTDIGDEIYHTANSSTGGKLNSIAVVKGTVYVGGEFNLVGEKPINYIAEWRADRIASGMYIYRIKTDHWQAVRKMVLIR